MAEAKKQDPYRSFRFQVRDGETGKLVAAFTQFSGIGIEMQMLSARSGSDAEPVRIPYGRSFAPVTLTAGVVGDNDFLDWLFASTIFYSGPRSVPLEKDIEVVALNEKGEDGVSWLLRKAMPLGYQLTPMDGSSSEVLSESLTFGIGGVERVVKKGWGET